MSPRARRGGCDVAQGRQRAGSRRGQPRRLCLPLRARSFRRWSAGAIGVTALGSIAFLADFSIGASIGTRARHEQRRARHPARLCHDLPRRRSHRLLRRALQPRPGSHRPRLRIRLLRLVHHDGDLRDLHLHLLRARGRDHGAGPVRRVGHPAVGGLPHLHGGGDSDRDLRHARAGATAVLDHAALARARSASPALGGRVRPRCRAGVRRVHGRVGWRSQLRRDRRERRGLLRTHAAAGGADRRDPRDAAPHPREPPFVVGVAAVRRARLDPVQRHQAGDRGLPRGVSPHPGRPRARCARRRAGAPVHRPLRVDHAAVARDRSGARAGRRRADQDQRDQRVLGVAGVVQRLHAPHQDVPRPRRVHLLQSRDRARR